MQVLVALNLERGEQQRSGGAPLLLMPTCITQNWAKRNREFYSDTLMMKLFAVWRDDLSICPLMPSLGTTRIRSTLQSIIAGSWFNFKLFNHSYMTWWFVNLVLFTVNQPTTAYICTFSEVILFSYASSSTLSPCQRVSEWGQFQTSSVAWSLRACFSGSWYPHTMATQSRGILHQM